jgi:trigger factor
VRGQLETQATRKASALVNDALIEKLIDGNPIEVPPSLVAEQQRQMLSEIYQLQQALGRQLPLGEEFWSGFEQRAERKVRAGLLLGAVAKQQQIAVTEADVDGRLEAIAQETGKHVAKVRAEYQGERRDGLRRQLLERKLLEYLASQATITDVEPKPAAAGEPKAESTTE